MLCPIHRGCDLQFSKHFSTLIVVNAGNFFSNIRFKVLDELEPCGTPLFFDDVALNLKHRKMYFE